MVSMFWISLGMLEIVFMDTQLDIVHGPEQRSGSSATASRHRRNGRFRPSPDRFWAEQGAILDRVPLLVLALLIELVPISLQKPFQREREMVDLEVLSHVHAVPWSRSEEASEVVLLWAIAAHVSEMLSLAVLGTLCFLRDFLSSILPNKTHTVIVMGGLPYSFV